MPISRNFFAARQCQQSQSTAGNVTLFASIRQSKAMLIVEGDEDCHSAGSFFKKPCRQPVRR